MSKFFAVAIAGAAAALATWAIRRSERLDEAEEAPPPGETVFARVKRNRRAYNAGSAIFSNALTFEGLDGETWSFLVGGEAFRTLLAGDTGTLVYAPAQEGQPAFFVSFERDRDGALFLPNTAADILPEEQFDFSVELSPETTSH